MNKEAEYKALCEDVEKCTICHKVKFSPHLENSDFLSHRENNEPCVNQWNNDYKCDYKESDIMIIGQDYGAFIDNQSPTDTKLKELIFDKLKINIDNDNHRLFLTNIANCYRQKTSTGKFNKGCLSICANKFMGRLIKIISPKIIIVLGQDTFDALAFCDGAELTCRNPIPDDKDNKSNRNNKFSTIIKTSSYELIFENGLKIPVFPVYHPGSYGKMNINKVEDEEPNFDWKKITQYIEKEKQNEQNNQ